MSDDEFGLDDDIFDDVDLAAIEEIEQKFTTPASQAVPAISKATISPSVTNAPIKASQDRSRFLHPPPAKRIRTNEWNVTSVPNRDYEDDTPDYAVIAAKDGKYRILDHGANPRTTSLAIPSLPVASQQQRPMASQRSFSGPVRTMGVSSVAPSSQKIQASQSRFAAITAALQEAKLGDKDAEEEMKALREQVAELQRAKEAADTALRVAREEKITKEGEISTIRRTMATLKESHAEKIAKVQEERQAAEDKRKQMERQMKLEMERLQTNLALRRQEIETSTRKASWSTHKRATGRTPARATSLQHLPENETPSRSSPLRIPARDSEAVYASKNTKGKGKASTFPAFVDSFQSTSPVKTPSKTQRATGSTARKASVPDMEAMFPPILHLDAPTPLVSSRSRATSFGKSSQPVASAWSVVGDESGPDWADNFESAPSELDVEETGMTLEEEAEVQNEMLGGAEEEEIVEVSLDLKEQLYRVLFAHVSLPLYQFTLQMLLSAHIPERYAEQATSYIQASSALVEAIAPRTAEYGTVLQAVVKALLRMARILCDTSSMVALAGVFNLLATMSLFLPKTTATLLPEEIDESIPPILLLVLDVTKVHAIPKESQFPEEAALLIKECLNLVEILCLKIPKDLLNQMRFILVEPTFTSHLLDARQPLWVKENTVQALSILFTYEDAFPILMAPLRDPDSDKIPLLERLSYIILEAVPVESLKQKHSLQTPVLTIFSQLAIASPNGLPALAQSQALIPVLVANLFHYSVRAWEENEDTYEEPDLILITDIIQATLRLLHYVVFQSDPQINLQQRIQYPPPKMNDLEHMFVVGLGRLSYADPPEWVSKPAKEALENASVIARELLENVVDGPEVDAIWISFQDSEENQGSDTDDEEMEARKVAQTDDDMILVD